MSKKESVAIVTGVSHAQGIGAAICRKLAEKSSHIFFTHFDAEANWPNKFKKELENNYAMNCESIDIDLSHSDAASNILDVAQARLGVPTILINNAAYSTQDGYMQLDADTLDTHYAVNMRASFLLSVEFARVFEKSHHSHGRIINLTSGQALGPMIGELAYVATKGAITAFTLSLSAELAPLGITVNAINPGPTDTGWMTADLKSHLKDKFQSGRIGLPEDAARLAAFLTSEDAEWITGQVINSEGGFLRA